jgi:hypothetical protein
VDVDLALDEFMMPAALASPVVEPVAPPAAPVEQTAAKPSREAEPVEQTTMPSHLELGFTFIRVPLSCFDVSRPERVFRDNALSARYVEKFRMLQSEGFSINAILQPNPEEYVFFFTKSKSA